MLRAQQRARVVSQSNRQLSQQRETHEREQRTAYWLRVLSVVPGISVAVNIRDSAVALRQFSRSGDPRDAFELFKAMHMALVDIAPTLYPVAMAARPARVALGAWARAALKSISRRRLLQGRGALAKFNTTARPALALPGYAANIAGEGAVPLHGPVNAGSQVKEGVQFISDGHHRYEVYRPKGESALRLKKTAEQPNELILYIRESGEHLLRADAPEPQPGPSRGFFHRPWEAVPAPSTAPVAMSRLEWMSRRPAASSSHWRAWGLALADSEVVELPPGRGLYRNRSSNARLLKLDDRYFELLADGSDIESEIVFLRRPGPLAELALSDFEHWWSHPPAATAGEFRSTERRLDAPRAVVRGARTAASRTTDRAHERRQPNPHAQSTDRALRDRQRGGDRQPYGGPQAHAGNLGFTGCRPACAVAGTGWPGCPALLSHRFAGGERRLFPAGFRACPRDQSTFLRCRGRHRVMDLSLHTERAVRDILLQHGFVVNEIPKGRSFLSVSLECTHPASEYRYLLLLKWTRNDALEFFRSRGAPVQLSDAWLRRLVDTRSISHSDRLQPARAALEQGRLVKLVAGLQRVPDSQRIVVFFIRVQ